MQSAALITPASEIFCRKATIRSEWTFFCLCSYEYNGPELETTYEQATKTGLIQNISPGREKERAL